VKKGKCRFAHLSKYRHETPLDINIHPCPTPDGAHPRGSYSCDNQSRTAITRDKKMMKSEGEGSLC